MILERDTDEPDVLRDCKECSGFRGELVDDREIEEGNVSSVALEGIFRVDCTGDSGVQGTVICEGQEPTCKGEFDCECSCGVLSELEFAD